MSVIQSLKVEGNIPCPTASDSKPPLPTRRKSNAAHANPSARPFNIRNTDEKHVNTEEELRNILLQAKAPALIGPTLIAKRMGYMSKIKQLNDGMYKHHVLEETVPPYKAQDFSLEGRKVESNTKPSAEGQLSEYNHDPEDGEIVTELTKEDRAPFRHPAKSTVNSAKSAKSFHSGVFSVKSDSGLQKPLALPMLTIGSDRHKTKGEYIHENGEDGDLYGLHYAKPGKDTFRGEQEEYEFRFSTPRKFRFRGEMREIRTPDSTGNYGSLSLSDLKACLHVNHSSEKSAHQEYIVKNYMEQFKKKRSGIKVNPYKMLKVTPRNQMRNSINSRYEFSSVDSYLKFNKQPKPAGKHVRAGTASGESQASVTDTVVLQMMSDLNDPKNSRQGEQHLNANHSHSKGNSELFQIKSEKIRHQRHSDPPLAEKSEKQIIQHIVYVPSGQTAKVKLIKS